MKRSKNEQEGTEGTEGDAGLAVLRRLKARLRRAHEALCREMAKVFPVGAVVEVPAGKRRVEARVVDHVVECLRNGQTVRLVVKRVKSGRVDWVHPLEKGVEVRVVELPEWLKPTTTNERN